MSALGRACRRLLGREPHDRPSAADPRSAVRQAIAHTRQQQAVLAAQAGKVFVERAEIEQALTSQHRVLVEAQEQIRQAMTLAQQAADDAHADGSVDPVPYELTAAGLQTQLDVVDASVVQLQRLRDGASSNLANAQTMLRENTESLDRALRGEIGLLSQLERLERQRVIAEAVRRRRRPGAADS